MTAVSHPPNHLYQFGPFHLEVANRRLLRDGEPVALTPKEFDLLLLLLEGRGRLVDKDELIHKLWAGVFVEENTLTRTVSRLRRNLGENSGDQRYIETVPKHGYRFMGQVTEIAGDDEEWVIETQASSRIVIEEEAATPAATLAGVDAEPIASRAPRGLLLAAAGVALLAFVFAGYWFLVRRPPRADHSGFRLVPFASLPGREEQPSFSPDGNQMALSWDGGEGTNLDIYVKQIGMGTPLRLTKSPADEINPEWSPDGRFIAFIRSSTTEGGVFITPVLGGPERRLSGVELDALGIGWSADGKEVAVAGREAAGDGAAILLINIETGQRRRLTSPPVSFSDNAPAVSPDGKWLAFVRTSNLSVSDLYLVAVAGGEPRRLTFDNQRVGGLDWTKDSAEIVFSSNHAGGSNLWRLAIGSGEPQMITHAGHKADYPSVARQGNRLAYDESYLDTNIWRMRILEKGEPGAGRNRRAPEKLITSGREDDSPQFSPDRKQIAFASGRSGSPEIWVCGEGGENPLQLTNFGGPVTGTPRWSPDGQGIAFDSRPEGNGDIYIIAGGGGAPRRLTSEPSHDVMPSWSGDGRWIYFCSNRSGDLQIWKVPAEGGVAVQVTRRGGFEAFESPDGKSLYYSKGRGVAGLWTVAVGGGDETPVPELNQAGYWRSWAVARNGIYFIAHEGDAPPRPVRFFDFLTRQLSTVGEMDREPTWATPGLTVSSDGRSILYAQIDRKASTIMMIENFR
jgi:Tol biopolymer transport system component/DNA-binding winged helix-turn-helix (wHTH) protein